MDLGPYDGIELRVFGDGQRYKLNLRTDTSWDGLSYCRSFDTEADKWQTIRLPFSEFSPTFRARTVKDGAKVNPSSIVSTQLMLSKFEYDGDLNPNFRLGEFSLPVQYIKSYLKTPVVPRYVLVSSAGVTRWNRPGVDVEKEPPAVKLNDELGGLLTFKLKGEDVVRESGIPFTILRPCALTEEPAGAPLEFDQGDVIKGKISREDVAELCVELLGVPSACNTTFEVKCTLPFATPHEPDPSAPTERNWTELVDDANLQKGVTGKTVDGVYTGRNPEKQVKENV